jgi:signal transduction histidine kinase/CheY-like chemotaxis protein
MTEGENAVAGESILIVEDDGILATSLKRILSGLGYVIFATVATGEEAITLVENKQPGLILMDIDLAGELNGIETAEVIRSFSDVPIVFLTGYSQESLIQEAKFTAPACYLIKPVPARELQANIEMALHRHALDRKLKESEEHSRTQSETLNIIFDSTPVIMMLIDRDYRIRAINQAGAAFTGRKKEELLGRFCGEVMRCPSADDTGWCGQTGTSLECPVHANVMHTFMTGEPVCEDEGLITVLRQDDSVTLDLIISTALVTFEKETMVLLTATDITERKKLERGRLEVERQLLNARRFESLVTLAGGIAHDFNNILTAVYGNMEMALWKLSPDSPAHMFVEEALKSSDRALVLANQMLTFTGQGHSRLEIVDLNEIVLRILDLSPADAASTVSVRDELHLSPVHVRGDPEQLQQVVLNLLNNALESVSGPESTITVATGVRECTAAYLSGSRIAEKPQEGRYAYLEVRDTGCGMDEEVLARLFEPFFSTKFIGRGLGMPMVYGIVKGYGGALLVDSQPRKGTTVRVLLPLAE